MTTKFDPRVQITINYEPDMGRYPEGTTTKKEALQFDVQTYRDGCMGLADLIEFASDVTVTVVEVTVPK